MKKFKKMRTEKILDLHGYPNNIRSFFHNIQTFLNIK